MMLVRLITAGMALTFSAALLSTNTTSALAGNEFFLGKWVIEKAVVAPWADPVKKPDDTEMKSLVGKSVTFKPQQIAGPGILACKKLTYEVTEGGADMLFQGSLTQKFDGSSQDPDKPAADLGFQGSSWKTLQTGCENEMDYSFVDDKTAEFGLNHYVYILKRQ